MHLQHELEMKKIEAGKASLSPRRLLIKLLMIPWPVLRGNLPIKQQREETKPTCIKASAPESLSTTDGADVAGELSLSIDKDVLVGI
ncbi:hypothetical protein GJAV_G00051310 [Gymnothorax javanicus]|nr:hypothetical protein GJAV_G00051310 [Gymnothorax javanicus]